MPEFDLSDFDFIRWIDLGSLGTFEFVLIVAIPFALIVFGVIFLVRSLCATGAV